MVRGQGLAANENESVRTSIVVGSLNECGNIDRFINQILTTLGTTCSFEIIVVDDGSIDGTREKLTQIAGSDKRIIAIFNEQRNGLLASNLQGIAIARGDYKIVMDCDMQHPPDMIPEVIKALDKGYEIAICSRYVKGGTVGRRNGLRGVISRVAILLGRIALWKRKSVLDNVSGFFGFDKRMKIPKIDATRGFKTLLYILAENPYAKVVEIPYSFQKRGSGDSKIVNNWRFVPRFLFEVMSIAKIAARAKKSPVESYTGKGVEYADRTVPQIDGDASD